MKIIIISAAAPPEPIVSGSVNWDIAVDLSKKNHEVWLISPYPSRPLGVKYISEKENRVTFVSDNFYHVNINSFTYPKYNLFFRLFESFDFGTKSIQYVNKLLKNYDLIYASPWPFIGQLMILILRNDKSKPIIMNVQDLYPESFINKISNVFIRKIFSPLYYIDKYIAKKSNHITVVSEGLKNVYVNRRNIKKDKLTIINNWQDESEFVKKIADRGIILSRFNLQFIKDKFVFMYLGNIGPVAGVEIIIKAFYNLNNDSTILLIAGSGSQKDKCIMIVDEMKIKNIHFIEVPTGLTSVVELQSLSDIMLLPILSNAAHSSIPSKLIAYMFSGKPIISSADNLSETANAILDSECGWITKSNSEFDWTQEMRNAYVTEKEVLIKKGKSGMNFALNNYSKSKGLKKINDLLTRYN